MAKFITGDAANGVEPQQHGGWFIGHFMDAGDLRQTDAVEIKWGRHKSGDRNQEGFAASPVAQTMSILISGRFRLMFRDLETGRIREVVLHKAGQYVMWDAGTYHDWEALTNSVVMTVRWPSVETQKKRCPECNALFGACHAAGCVAEICGGCGQAFVSCECDEGEYELVPWNGLFPPGYNAS